MEEEEDAIGTSITTEAMACTMMPGSSGSSLTLLRLASASSSLALYAPLEPVVLANSEHEYADTLGDRMSSLWACSIGICGSKVRPVWFPRLRLRASVHDH